MITDEKVEKVKIEDASNLLFVNFFPDNTCQKHIVTNACDFLPNIQRSLEEVKPEEAVWLFQSIRHAVLYIKSSKQAKKYNNAFVENQKEELDEILAEDPEHIEKLIEQAEQRVVNGLKSRVKVEEQVVSNSGAAKANDAANGNLEVVDLVSDDEDHSSNKNGEKSVPLRLPVRNLNTKNRACKKPNGTRTANNASVGNSKLQTKNKPNQKKNPLRRKRKPSEAIDNNNGKRRQRRKSVRIEHGATRPDSIVARIEAMKRKGTDKQKLEKLGHAELAEAASAYLVSYNPDCAKEFDTLRQGLAQFFRKSLISGMTASASDLGTMKKRVKDELDEGWDAVDIKIPAICETLALFFEHICKCEE